MYGNVPTWKDNLYMSNLHFIDLEDRDGQSGPFFNVTGEVLNMDCFLDFSWTFIDFPFQAVCLFKAWETAGDGQSP